MVLGILIPELEVDIRQIICVIKMVEVVGRVRKTAYTLGKSVPSVSISTLISTSSSPFLNRWILFEFSFEEILAPVLSSTI